MDATDVSGGDSEESSYESEFGKDGDESLENSVNDMPPG
jgi:hypothetical protein